MFIIRFILEQWHRSPSGEILGNSCIFVERGVVKNMFIALFELMSTMRMTGKEHLPQVWPVWLMKSRWWTTFNTVRVEANNCPVLQSDPD